MEAVKQNKKAIKFVLNPNKEIVVHCLLSIPEAAQLLQDHSYDLEWEEEDEERTMEETVESSAICTSTNQRQRSI